LATYSNYNNTPTHTNVSLVTDFDVPLICSPQEHIFTWPQVVAEVSPVVTNPLEKCPICWSGDGTTEIGSINPAPCNITYIWCPLRDKIGCDRCQSTKLSTDPHNQRRSNCTRIEPNGLDNKTRCVGIAPHKYGTRTTVGYWLCGQTAYTALPRDWSGLCVLTILTDHTIILSANLNYRKKRYANLKLKPHDPYWGTNVPSIVTTTAQADEISALRLMVLQNRMVLGLLVASKGGVCAMVGRTCCTFIPANTDDGGAVRSGIANMSATAKVMAATDIEDSGIGGWMEEIMK